MRKIMMAAMVLAGASGAQAADMPDYALRGSYAPVRPMWDGFYVGGQASQGWSKLNPPANSTAQLAAQYNLQNNLSVFFPGVGRANGDKTGYGGFAGYNSQYDDVLFGLEGNYSHSSLTATSNQAFYLTSPSTPANAYVSNSQMAVTVKDYGSLRLRGGYVVGNFLPYAFIGGAIANTDITQRVGVSYSAGSISPVPPFLTTTERDRVVYGYSAGVGMDVMLVGGLFARAEYEYVRFTNKIETAVNTVRVGVGYKF